MIVEAQGDNNVVNDWIDLLAPHSCVIESNFPPPPPFYLTVLGHEDFYSTFELLLMIWAVIEARIEISSNEKELAWMLDSVRCTLYDQS